MKNFKKILSVLICVLMLTAVAPFSASAATPEVKFNEVTKASIPAGDCAAFRFIPEESGTYVVISDNGGSGWDIDPYIKVYDDDDSLLAQDDDNDYAETANFYCVYEFEAGKEYYLCLGDYNDEEVEYDFIIKAYAVIDHQPTADEPYVTVTEGADAEYQWYRVTGNIVDVTDENATAREGDIAGEYATYDSANGWTGVHYWENLPYIEYNFFDVLLFDGCTIKMTADSYADCFGIWCECGKQSNEWDEVEANEAVEFTADHACIFHTWGDYEQVPHLKAEMPELIKVNTGAELVTDEAGEYFCLVTFDGCRMEASDAFEVTEIAVDYPEISLSASASKVNYKSSVGLNAVVENMPANAKIDWILEGSAFAIAADGNTCTATSFDAGTSKITVKILLDDGTYATDANGDVISDSVEITAEYTWWQWIIRIVLFGWIWY